MNDVDDSFGADGQLLNTDTLRFDLKKPCADCPFRRDVPHHEGIATSIVGIADSIKDGVFAHTCHKTDPRSDGIVEGYTGEVQHCAGAIIFLLKSEAPLQTWMASAYERGLRLLKYDREDARIFSGFKEMVEHYLPFIRKTLASRRSLTCSRSGEALAQDMSELITKEGSDGAT